MIIDHSFDHLIFSSQFQMENVNWFSIYMFQNIFNGMLGLTCFLLANFCKFHPSSTFNDMATWKKGNSKWGNFQNSFLIMPHNAIHVRDKPNQGPKKELGFEGVANYFRVKTHYGWPKIVVINYFSVIIFSVMYGYHIFDFIGCNHNQMNQHWQRTQPQMGLIWTFWLFHKKIVFATWFINIYNSLNKLHYLC